MNKLTRKSISLLLSGTMVLGGLTPVRESKAIEVSEPLDYIEDSSLDTIYYKASGVCGEGVYFEYVDNYVEMQDRLTIYGNGEMYDLADFQTDDGYYRSPAPWQYHAWTIHELVVEEGITRIGNSSLIQNIPSISLPESLTSIGMFAFCVNREIESIIIPSNVKEIEQSAFFDCIMLKEIWIPENLESLGYGVFTNCTSLTDIYFGGTEEQWNQLNPNNIAEVGSTRTVESDGQSETTFVYTYHDVTIHYNSITSDSDEPEQEPDIQYSPLPSATLHTSYLTQIPNMTASATLISGNLPKGLGIYPDGTIGGIPTQIGTFEFVVNTSEGEVGYSITVQEATSENVEADNDFEIIERVPTIDSNETDHIFEVSGEYGNFLHVYLDGELLIRDVDYTAEEGSTKITIAAQTFAQLDEGSHTINATFAPTSATVNPSTGTTSSNSASSNVAVQKVAQTFEKTVPASTTIVVMPFSDVTQNDWFYSQVLFCYKNKTFSGVTETTYEPNTGMTRGMMAVVLHSLAHKPSSESAGFSDVADGEWYANAVNWLSQKGIDDSVGTFRPSDLITREETAKMLYNFCTDQGIFLPLVTSSTASDIDSVSENGKLAVTALFQRNIFGGDEYGNFNPEKSSTRAEISTVMKNFMSVVM